MKEDKPISVIWLGQGGFIFEFQGQRLVVDPFLSNIVEERQGLKRLMAPPVSIDDLKPDIIFITHDHLDHLDPIALPKIHKKYPKVSIVGPESVQLKARRMGFDKSILLPVQKNTTYNFVDFKITVTPAYHSDPFSVGCIISVGDKQIYLSADTILHKNLIAEIKSLIQKPLYAVLVCINGKLENMDWKEAVSLVEALKPKIAIPMHYGMFAENTADPLPFVLACKERGIISFELIPGSKTII